MQVEDVAGISLAARGALEDQRDLAVGHSVLRQVVIDDQRVAAGVAEVLADGGTCKRCIVAHRSRVGSRSGHHDGVGQGAALLELVDEGSHGRCLLADGDIDAIYRLAGLVARTLVDDGVHRDGGLADLAVTDDELTLATADGDHRVDGLEARLQRLVHRLAEDDAGSLALQRQAQLVAVDGSLAVDGLCQNVDHAAQQALAHLDGGDGAGAAHLHVLGHGVHLVQQDDTHVALLQVHGHAGHAVLKLHELVGLDIVQAIGMSHAVTHLQDGAFFLKGHLTLGDVFDELLFQYIRYFTGINHLL